MPGQTVAQITDRIQRSHEARRPFAVLARRKQACHQLEQRGDVVLAEIAIERRAEIEMHGDAGNYPFGEAVVGFHRGPDGLPGVDRLSAKKNVDDRVVPVVGGSVGIREEPQGMVESRLEAGTQQGVEERGIFRWRVLRVSKLLEDRVA